MATIKIDVEYRGNTCSRSCRGFVPGCTDYDCPECDNRPICRIRAGVREELRVSLKKTPIRTAYCRRNARQGS